VKRFTNKALNEIEEIEKEKEECDDKCSVMPENFDEKLEEKIEKNKTEKDEKIMDDKYVIKIPSNAIKEDLHDLKAFMQTQDS
jgi:hypothetical protein